MNIKKIVSSFMAITIIVSSLTSSVVAKGVNSATDQNTEWNSYKQFLQKYDQNWNNTEYRGAVTATIPETALMGNGDVGVNSNGNQTEKTYNISKKDFWNAGDLTTESVFGTNPRRVSPLSVGGLTIRKKAGGTENIKPTITGCGAVAGDDLDGIIDGKMSQESDTWACAGLSHTNNVGQHWFQVDFGATKTLAKYTIYHQGAYVSTSPNFNTADYKISVSTDGDSFEQVENIVNNSKNETSFTFDIPKKVRYVKVEIKKPAQDDNKVARIPEMSFIDDKGTNIITGEVSSSFSEKLNIDTGVLDTQMIYGNVPVKLSTWVSATDNVMITEISTSVQEGIDLEAALWVKTDSTEFPLTASVTGNTVQVSKKSKNYVQGINKKSWTSEVVMDSKIIGVDATATKSSDKESKLSFKLNPGENVKILTAIGGGGQNYDWNGVLNGIAPSTQAVNISKKYTDIATIQALKTENDEWWKNYWLKSYVNIGDEQLQKYYYASLYYMAATNRGDKLPSGIFGVWTTTDGATWNGDYHLNYNYIAPFYGMFSSNRAEMTRSVKDPLLDYMEEGKKRAKEDLKKIYPDYINGGSQPGDNGTVWNNGRFSGRPDLANGIDDAVLFPVALGPWGSTPWHEGDKGGYITQVYNAAFSAQALTAYYNYTKDGAYLKEVYPFLLANANFYEKWCEKQDLGNGKYRYNVWSGAHEGTFDLNAGTVIGAIKNILASLIDGAKSGDIVPPADKLTKWKDMYDNFAQYPVETYTQTGEKYIPLSEVGVKIWPNSAHVALEFIEPSQDLGFDSNPTLREAARNSIKIKESINPGSWSGINDIPKVFLQAIRSGFDPRYVMNKFKGVLSSSMRENGTIQDGYHGIEKAGAIQFINSMLLQSDKGILKVFPNWTSANASFTRLQERGAFLVSASMTDSVVKDVTVTSQKGGMLKIVNPWPGLKVKVTDSKASNVEYAVNKTQNSNENTIEFGTVVGETYTISSYVDENTKPFTIVPLGNALDRSSGIKASVNVAPVQGVTHTGNESVVFQFRDANVPVGLNVTETDITKSMNFSSSISVSDSSKASYRANIFVLDSFNFDTELPRILSENIELR